jgi:tellurite resistance protein TehA-like permease
MKYRIAIWSAAGLLVASAWAVYFLVASKDHPTEPIVSTLVQLTCPVAIIGSHYPVSLYAALVANVATYALIGLVVEILRRQSNHSN